MFHKLDFKKSSVVSFICHIIAYHFGDISEKKFQFFVSLLLLSKIVAWQISNATNFNIDASGLANASSMLVLHFSGHLSTFGI